MRVIRDHRWSGPTGSRRRVRSPTDPMSAAVGEDDRPVVGRRGQTATPPPREPPPRPSRCRPAGASSSRSRGTGDASHQCLSSALPDTLAAWQDEIRMLFSEYRLTRRRRRSRRPGESWPGCITRTWPDPTSLRPASRRAGWPRSTVPMKSFRSASTAPERRAQGPGGRHAVPDRRRSAHPVP